ncbi:MAG: 16S rRNA processing protein RimM [Bacteroidetes bacterium]|nr:MAG: 16S rRNA processing protein RimM [Bacteroidota bacterium]
MDKKDYYFLGKITKTSGFNGNLMFFFDVDDTTPYIDLEAVFVELGAKGFIPFVIEKISFRHNNTAIVKLADIETNEDAVSLIGCDLFLPLAFLPPLKGKKFYFHEIMGFSIIDKNQGDIGFVTDVLDNTSQPVFVINKDNDEILVPMTDEIILNVDRENKVIEIEAPEGLIDIYLNK